MEGHIIHDQGRRSTVLGTRPRNDNFLNPGKIEKKSSETHMMYIRYKVRNGGNF